MKENKNNKVIPSSFSLLLILPVSIEARDHENWYPYQSKAQGGKKDPFHDLIPSLFSDGHFPL